MRVFYLIIQICATHRSAWKTILMHNKYLMGNKAISYPESSGFLVCGATPGRLWGHRKNSTFLIGCSVMVSIVLLQKSCGDKIRCPQSLPGVALLTKKPEDSGDEIRNKGETKTRKKNPSPRWDLNPRPSVI